MDPFQRFLHDNGCIVTRDQRRAKEITHVSLTGGTYNVPIGKRAHMFAAMDAACEQGVRLHIVEKKGGVFRFFVDIDLKESTAPSTSSLETMMDEVRRLIDVVLDEEVRFTMLVCRTPPREIDGGKMKIGIHVHFSFNVDSNTACLLADALALGFEETFGPRPAQPWREVFDHIPYRALAPGLRMKYHYKRDLDTVYVPWFMVERDGTPMDIPTTRPKTWELCSINPVSPNARVVQLADPTLRTKLEALLNEQEMARKAMEHRGPVVDVTKRCDSLVRFLQIAFPRHGMTDASVRKVELLSKTKVIVYADCRYCEHHGGRHRSNHIYFVVTKGEGVEQRCHDDACHGYRSPIVPLPARVERLTFGGKDPLPPVSRRTSVMTDRRARDLAMLESVLQSLK